MLKAGRYTAALILVLVGGAVVSDNMLGTGWTPRLLDWWPILFILLGLEYLWLQRKSKAGDRPIKLDIIGVALALIISALVVVSTQSSLFSKDFSFDLDRSLWGNEQRFEKPAVPIPISAHISEVKFENENGDLTLRSGDVSEMKIEWVVYVDLSSAAEAERVAADSVLEYNESGNELEVKAIGKKYSKGILGRRKAVIDLVVTVPKEKAVDYEIELTNGKIDARALPVLTSFEANTTNGAIHGEQLAGEITLHSTNGKITVEKTAGKLDLHTTNGSLQVRQHDGDAEMETTNGAVQIADINGNIEASSMNGNIMIDGAPAALKASTTNGSVTVASQVVAGNWQLETSNGSVTLTLPHSGDYQLNGEARSASFADGLPFQAHNGRLSGSLGSGNHSIDVETNATLTIRAID